MDEENKDPIEKLNEELYSPDAPEVNKILKRGVYSSEGQEQAREIKQSWDGHPRRDTKVEKVFGWTKREQPIFKKILWFALGFFILCFVLAAFLYLRGVNTVSADKINLQFSAPLSVSASNPFSLGVTIENLNNSDLINGELVVDYPEGTKTINDNTKPLVTDSIQVGSLGRGQIVKKNSEAVLFGQEGERKKINVTFNYKVPGSSQVFKKQASYDVTITSAPVTVTVDSVKELNSGQDISFDIKVTSNSSNVLNNIAVEPSFPYGFTLKNSDPGLTPVGNLTSSALRWAIDNLSPTETKEFHLSGTLKGQKDEEKLFQFKIGSLDPNNPQRIVNSFVDVQRLVAIKLPFISTDITVGDGGLENKDIVRLGQTLRGNIKFQNNLTTNVNDLELSLKLNDPSNLIDKTRIQVNSGFYSSLDNTIVWNKQTLGDLLTVTPNNGGNVIFNMPFNRLSDDALKSGAFRNLSINLDLTIKGKRLSDSPVPEEIILLDSKTVKVATEATIATKSLYTVGPFKNIGGIPPHINRATTYTIVFDLSNTLNEVKDAFVTAVLPPNVSFTGNISPRSEGIIFDQSNNQIKWNVGTLYAGQGYKSQARELAFQITFTPSANQADTIPTLVSNIHFEGVDTYTGEKVSDDSINLTTELRQDPGFNYGQDKVSR